jgi:hypothetical protein
MVSVDTPQTLSTSEVVIDVSVDLLASGNKNDGAFLAVTAAIRITSDIISRGRKCVERERGE